MRLLTFTLIATALFAQPQRDRHVIIISLDGFAAYALQDQTLPLPTLRKLIAGGAVAESMQPVNPTVTWPNHTAIVTGVTPAAHSVIYNGLARRGPAGTPVKVEPWVSKDELVKGKTLYDLASENGLKTGEVDWVAILRAPAVQWSFFERPDINSPVVREMIAAGKTTEEQIRGFEKSNIILRDEIWTRAGEHIIETHKPNILLFHLLTTDSSQHRYGARSLGANTALTLADAKVARLIAAVDRAGIADKTTFLIVSDHGFHTYKQTIRPNAFLRQQGLIRDGSDGPDCDAWVIPEGGTAMVYITRPEKKTELLKKLKTEFAAVPGITSVLDSGDFGRLGLPDPSKNDRMADLVLTAADGYGFSGADKGEVIVKEIGDGAGAHGYLNNHPDMQAIFIAAGAGIRTGVKLGAIRNLDVAPTAARLLGLEMKNVEGRVLTEILK